MRRIAALASLAAALGCVAWAGEEPKDSIKQHKYEVQPVPYRDEGRRDPFVPLVPLRAAEDRETWKVRIASLKLSSVVTGKKKVAVFTELHGPEYSYILVDGVLIGPDHKAIPGVAGTIEKIGTREFHVVLKQGGEKVEYTLTDWDAAVRRKAAANRQGGKPEGGVPVPSGETGRSRYP